MPLRAGRKWMLLVTIAVLAALASVAVILEMRAVSDVTPSPDEIELPSPRTTGEMSVEETIALRRSVRRFANEPLTLQELSQLLWAAQGITDPEAGKRAVPSAGMTYPLEIYVAVGESGVSELVAGVFHYSPHEHSLSKVKSGDVRDELCAAAVGQTWVRAAPVSIVIAAVFERTEAKYGERGKRYVFMEAGHAAQNLYLQATALGLGMTVVGAFLDDDVRELLSMPDDHAPLYVVPIGRRAS
ncbi:SagB/ThcOx family dehydrogenase [Candidatus Alkanophaga liquidiphilum]